MSDSTIRWEQDGDGVVTLTLDDPSSSANTMNDAYVRSMGEVVDRLERARESIRGVVPLPPDHVRTPHTHFTTSRTVATPMPPPAHRVTTAYRPPRRSSSSRAVPRSIAPVAPSG